MARGINKLTALAAKTTKPGRYGDGAGLYLVVAPTGARKWVFRFTHQGKVNEMGLGSASANEVSLADARTKAEEARRWVARGEDPIVAREAAAKLAAGKPTFGQCAEAFIAGMESGWRNAKHRDQWRNTLRQYAASLSQKPVDTITTADVLTVLKPIWQTKPETASRVRGRIESVLDAARANGHISESTANPARWRSHLATLLPSKNKLRAVRHHAAMPFDEVPAFVKQLRARKAVAALALEFIILTAARSGEVFGALWPEINIEAKVWTVPSSRMKARRGHRVPLSPRAIEILGEMGKARQSDFVFPGTRPKRPLSNMATEMLLRRMKAGDITTHGFRSSFRDWAGELTSFPREVAEAALAHSVGDNTERAYRRGDALAKRRALMEAWAAYLEKAPPGANVIKPAFGGAKA
jgi:integrase